MGKVERHFTVSSMSSRQHDAIAAAQRGDWDSADKLELEYLTNNKANLFPREILSKLGRVAEGRLRATNLYRGLAPNGQIGVRWTTATEQQEEEGDYDDDEVWFTDIDGNLIEVDREEYN